MLATVRDSSGKPCVEGICAPAWTDKLLKYRVQGDWAQKLWQAYKLSDQTYKDDLHLCRDGVLAGKRNFDDKVGLHVAFQKV